MQALVKMLLGTILFFIFIENAELASRIDPLVETQIGLIRGLQATDGDYAMFLGIPYAKVEEDNPFGPSVPLPEFDTPFEAFDDSAICPQIRRGDISSAIGSLDCLHLSVYVPNKASSENRLPVLVWIYGGAFEVGNFGRTRFSPSNLVRHDVILVTLNYRVGPYGFLCLETRKVPGNQGLKDQLLALKWVKDHIEAFGGNADEITIFGESAGGVSVDLHLHYTEQKLFNKVIAQSGNALCPWAVVESGEAFPIRIAQYLGFESDDIEEIMSFLSTITPELVVVASAALGLEFRPCVEKEFENVFRLIGEYPINTDIQKNRDIPILLGFNDKESLQMVDYTASLQDLFGEYLEQFFNFESNEATAMEQIIRNFYIGDEPVSQSTIMSLVDFDSDFIFNYPTARSVSRYLKNGGASVYYYVFSYNGDRTSEMNIESSLYNITKVGAAHADELHYLFYQPQDNNDATLEDQLMSDQISTLWTNFAKTGNPTPEKSTLLPVTWTPVSNDSMTYLNIGSELEVKTKPFHDRMAFWDLFYKLNIKAQKSYQHD